MKCPMKMSNSAIPHECDGNKCEWWVSVEGKTYGCAIQVMAETIVRKD